MATNPLQTLNSILSGINQFLYTKTPPGKALLKVGSNLARESVKTAETFRNRPKTPVNLLKTLGGQVTNVAGAPFEFVGGTTRRLLPEQVQQTGVQTPAGQLDIGGLVDFLSGAAVPVGGGVSKGKSLLRGTRNLDKVPKTAVPGKTIPGVTDDLKIFTTNKVDKFGTKAGEPLVPFPNLGKQRGPEDIVEAGRKAGVLMNEPFSPTKALKSEKGSIKIPEIKPQVSKELDNLNKTPDESIRVLNKEVDQLFGRTKTDKFIRAFPYSDESARVASIGRAGKEITNKARRVNAKTVFEKGKVYQDLDNTGVKNLTPEESKNLILAREGKETFMNDKVQQVSQALDNSFIGRAPRELGIDPIEKYAPRVANEAGKNYYRSSKGESDILAKIMKDTGVEDPSEALKMLKGGQRKAFFERERILEELPPEFRDFSAKPWFDYAEEYARRKAFITEFGGNDKLLNQLKQNVDPRHLPMVDEYIQRIKGTPDPQELKKLGDFMKTSMVVSKISPTTTVANEFQAMAGAFLKDGISGLIDSMRPGGKKLAKELGLDTIRGATGEFLSSESIATKWMKAMGMEASEMRGIARSARAGWSGIDRAWKKLVKNPADKGARKYFNDLGMYMDESKLAQDLKRGSIGAEQKALGAIEYARQIMHIPFKGERPPWANAPVGSGAYIFHNYVLHQLNLLRKAPLHRQIAYVTGISALTGLPAAYLNNVIMGREQPTTVAEMWEQGKRYGAANPLDLDYTLGTERGQTSFITGGFSPYLNIGAQAIQGSPRGVARETFKALPIPFAGKLAPRLFPPQTRQSSKGNLE